MKPSLTVHRVGGERNVSHVKSKTRLLLFSSSERLFIFFVLQPIDNQKNAIKARTDDEMTGQSGLEASVLGHSRHCDATLGRIVWSLILSYRALMSLVND